LQVLNVSEEPFALADGNCQGYARQRTIAVSPLAELPHKTRFHELAHVVLEAVIGMLFEPAVFFVSGG
jgi:hypothetical protein